jgi:hypothetical protein
MKNKCGYSEIKTIYYIENYSHIMCKSIREYLYLKQFNGILNKEQKSELIKCL